MAGTGLCRAVLTGLRLCSLIELTGGFLLREARLALSGREKRSCWVIWWTSHHLPTSKAPNFGILLLSSLKMGPKASLPSHPPPAARKDMEQFPGQEQEGQSTCPRAGPEVLSPQLCSPLGKLLGPVPGSQEQLPTDTNDQSPANPLILHRCFRLAAPHTHPGVFRDLSSGECGGIW